MSWRDVLTIRADADPIVTMRVSALIAVDNTIPALLSASRLASGELRIVVELCGVAEEKVAYLARKLESSIPTVISVSRHRLGRNAVLCEPSL